jgi:hypothetical protein
LIIIIMPIFLSFFIACYLCDHVQVFLSIDCSQVLDTA